MGVSLSFQSIIALGRALTPHYKEIIIVLNLVVLVVGLLFGEELFLESSHGLGLETLGCIWLSPAYPSSMVCGGAVARYFW